MLKWGTWQLWELGEMVRISTTLISGRGLDPHLEYGVTLKLVVNIYSFNEPTKYKRLITGLALIDTLKKKKVRDMANLFENLL